MTIAEGLVALCKNIIPLPMRQRTFGKCSKKGPKCLSETLNLHIVWIVTFYRAYILTSFLAFGLLLMMASCRRLVSAVGYGIHWKTLCLPYSTKENKKRKTLNCKDSINQNKEIESKKWKSNKNILAIYFIWYLHLFVFVCLE